MALRCQGMTAWRLWARVHLGSFSSSIEQGSHPHLLTSLLYLNYDK